MNSTKDHEEPELQDARLRAVLFANLKSSGYASIIVGIFLVATSLTTIAVLAGYPFQIQDMTTVVWLLNLDLILALSLIAIVARRIVAAWISRRKISDKSTLHIRLVASFSLVAVVPALLVAVFSGLFLNFGIESWFNDRVKTAITESRLVAEAYLQEHQNNIAVAALGMANSLNRSANRFLTNPKILGEIMNNQTVVRELSESVLVDSRGNTIARAGFGFSLGFNFSSDDFLKDILDNKAGEVVIVSGRSDDRAIAGVKLVAFTNVYLLVGKYVKPKVLDHLSRTKGATAQYAKLEVNRETLKLKFVLIFGVVTVILLLAAIWIGWSLASQLSTPIGNLIEVAEKVRVGDLEARVIEGAEQEEDEISTLNRTFNRMIEQLNSQRNGLMEVNRQLDERRKFTETVLAGVSAGVIGLDKSKSIHLYNRSASELLNIDLNGKIGQKLVEVVPQMKKLFETRDLAASGVSHGEISYVGEAGNISLVVSVAVERIEKEIIGYVITFDDVTELLSAQRKAAWADVARRIAHEIKNPLTPIQLSAERLNRKYIKEIKSDKTTFLKCTETIIRQVKEIGEMVNEFSSFARMPQPNIKSVNIGELCSKVVFAEQIRFPSIDYELNLPNSEFILYCDSQQIGQLVTNLLKNAAEGIEERIKNVGAQNYQGLIVVQLLKADENIVVNIIDNGTGVETDLLNTITEPYVTTREKGTGLGLAIAKKIMEDHNGELIISNNLEQGLKASLLFQASADQT